MVAPLGAVGRRLRDGEDVRIHHRHGHIQLRGQAAGVLVLESGLEGGLHIVGPHVAAIPLGGPQKEGRIRPTGEGGRRLGHLSEKCFQGHGGSPFHRSTEKSVCLPRFTGENRRLLTPLHFDLDASPRRHRQAAPHSSFHKRLRSRSRLLSGHLGFLPAVGLFQGFIDILHSRTVRCQEIIPRML